ncbi:MAG: hypothetical protein AAFQ71_11400 [Planctomycetota bacterium]
MPTLTLTHVYSTGLGENQYVRAEYLLEDATDDAAARAYAAANVPTTDSSLPLRQTDLTRSETGDFVVRAQYSLAESAGGTTKQTTTAAEERLTVGTQSVRRLVSLATISETVPMGETATDYAGAINQDEDGNIEGVDVVVPRLTLAVSEWFAPASITQSFKRTIADLTGTVNNATFRGWAAGEVLFLGARINPIRDDLQQVDYEFAIEANVTGFTIAPGFSIDKKGHEVTWTAYETETDTNANRARRVPAQVNVEQVYATASFDGLGL